MTIVRPQTILRSILSFISDSQLGADYFGIRIVSRQIPELPEREARARISHRRSSFRAETLAEHEVAVFNPHCAAKSPPATTCWLASAAKSVCARRVTK